MARKIDIVDDDGNALTPPEPDSPVAQIIYLLEYGRSRGFIIGPRVQIGDTIVEVRDHRQAVMLHREHKTGEPELVPGSDMATVLGVE